MTSIGRYGGLMTTNTLLWQTNQAALMNIMLGIALEIILRRLSQLFHLQAIKD